MSLVLSGRLDWSVPEPRWRRLSEPCGHLDRAEAAAMEGDLRAAAHFFNLAAGAIGDACATAEAVNLLPGDGMTRLREIAWRLADGAPEPTCGWAIEYRCAEDGAEISVWLTLGRAGPETGALLTVRDAGAAGQ